MTITFLYFRAIIMAMMMVFTVTAHADVVKGIAAYKVGDYQTALNEFHKSADEGSADAQFYIGVLYDFGYIVEQDDQEAVKWYRRAAEQGQPDAQHNLGQMYFKGRGVEQVDQEAAVWFRRAAQQGNAIAQYNIGVMYAKGEGVLQDYNRAHMWANIGADNGHDVAVELRKTLEELMTPQQISNAQAMARACLESQYKNC